MRKKLSKSCSTVVLEPMTVEPMTAKAGSRGHVRWAGRMTSCVMTHDLAMPAECTGRSSTLLLVSWREPAAARAASRLFFFFWRVSGIPETYAKYAPETKTRLHRPSAAVDTPNRVDVGHRKVPYTSIRGRRGLVLTRSAAQGPQKKMHAGCS